VSVRVQPEQEARAKVNAQSTLVKRHGWLLLCRSQILANCQKEETMRNLIFVLLALALIGLVLSCSPLAAPAVSM
jgi:hypothetical protein